jgi:hypothetical protein
MNTKNRVDHPQLRVTSRRRDTFIKGDRGIEYVGTDRVEVVRKPCPCGLGEIVIDSLTPDHGWLSGQWVDWDGRIDCDACRERYRMYAANPSERPRLALIADVRQKEHRFEEASSAEKAFMASAPVQALIDRLIKRIEQEPSLAAKYRVLKGLGHYYTYGTFNRHWRGPAAWVNECIRSTSIPAVLKLLGEEDSALVDHAGRVAELWKLSEQPVPAI